MGLASKLASAQANPSYYGPPGGGAYPGQAPPGQAPPGQYPGQYPPGGAPPPGGQKAGAPYQAPQYQAYAGGAGGSKPPGGPGGPAPYGGPQGQQPMGGPPMMQGGPGGAPPMAGPPLNPQAVMSILQQTITENNIQSFYPPGSPKLNMIMSSISSQISILQSTWRIPGEVAMDFVKLALFDVVIYIDDSGSMAFEEGGERIKDLKLILERVATAATLFDHDGISLRFMNNDFAQNNIKNNQQIEEVVHKISFRGLTPMGTALRNKVLDPLVVVPARAGQLQKPVLVITITDGQPAGEPEGAVQEAVLYATGELGRTQYGPGAVSFQFAQVGNDLRAREFLAKLDGDPKIGHLIDCTSNYEVEADEMAKASPPITLTVELWLAKLILGAIDSSYDRKDEKQNHPAPTGFGPQSQQYGGAPPPQGQYGAPPPHGQQGYGAPPGQYGAPQGQYGAPQGQYGAPQGQYGAPQGQYGGAPPPGQYGAPPPGQYGAPPPGQYGAGGYGQQPGKYH